MHSPSFAQALTKISTSSTYEKYAEEGLYAMYNWQFNKASEIASYFQNGHPEHPTGYFLEAMIIYWKNYPLEDESKEYNKHMELLEKSYELAEEIIETDEDNEDAILFKLMAKSVMIRNYDNYGKTMKAVGAAREIYKLMMECIEKKHQYVEFYFPSGIYNYYREYYPDQHPVYKPFMIFFKSGDKDLGLKELVIAIRQAVFTKPEAMEYLAYIYFNNENKKREGLKLYKKLNQLFPKNTLFLLDYLSALAKSKKYREINILISKVDWDNMNSFYKAGMETFNGIALQKVKKQQNEAKQAFEKALYYNKENDNFGDQFYFYIYDGLASYWREMGNEEYVEKYSKQARKYN